MSETPAAPKVCEGLPQSAVFRAMIVETLKARKTLACNNCVELGDWPTDPENGPQILVYDGMDSKISGARANPNFTSTSHIMIDARWDAQSLCEARKIGDVLQFQITQCILTDDALNRLVQQFVTVQTQKKISSDSGKHVGSLLIEFALEYYESADEYFMPINPVDLEEIGIHVDLQNRFDAAGTYPNLPFPNSVASAPRTIGPDGRDEGYIEVDALNT